MWPELGDGVQALVRTAYGAILLGTLLLAARHGRRYFISERWGGYGQSSPGVDAIQNPRVYPALMAVWAGAAVLLVVGRWSVWAALINWIICHHVFIRLRWNGLLRGLGAPGFLTNWVACAVFLLEWTHHHAPSLRPLALLTLQIDYAFVMLSAGAFKVWSGYANDRGFEYALANPQWSYWHRLVRRVPPGHWVFRVLNQLAWSSEVAVATLVVVPWTRAVGGLLNIALFGFIATQLRLALLCPTAVLISLLYFEPGSFPGRQLESVAAMLPASTAPAMAVPGIVNEAMRIGLWAYLLLLPLAHGGLALNVYGRRALPWRLQGWLEKYTNHFGMIVWRVFSYDVVSYCIMVHCEKREAPHERTLLSHFGRFGSRFNDVGESLVLTCVFNSLKYYASNRAIFVERLLRYARTLPCPADSRLVFEHDLVQKTATGFALVPTSEYLVDPAAGTIEERVLEAGAARLAAQPAQVAHEGVRPGSYAPMKRAG